MIICIQESCSNKADGLSLLCTSPRLPASLLQSTSSLFLHYSVVMDGAPGPNPTDPSLALFLKPDPVFTKISQASLQYQVNSNGNITIEVSQPPQSNTMHCSVCSVPQSVMCMYYMIGAAFRFCKQNGHHRDNCG